MLRVPLLLTVLAVLTPTLAAQGSADANRALVRQVYIDLAAGDVQAAVAVLDEHVVWNEGPPSPAAGQYVGRGTVATLVLRRLLEDGVTATPDSLWIEDGQVMVAGANHRADPETGHVAATPFRHRWRILDGRAVSVDRSAIPLPASQTTESHTDEH